MFPNNHERQQFAGGYREDSLDERNGIGRRRQAVSNDRISSPSDGSGFPVVSERSCLVYWKDAGSRIRRGTGVNGDLGTRQNDPQQYPELSPRLLTRIASRIAAAASDENSSRL